MHQNTRLTYHRYGTIKGVTKLQLSGPQINLFSSGNTYGQPAGFYDFPGTVVLSNARFALYAANLRVGSLLLNSGGQITIYNTSTITSTANATIGWNAMVTSDGNGYPSQQGYSPGSISIGSGGTYGGFGGLPNASSPNIATVYGSLLIPQDLGSGGSSNGSSGGGAIHFIATQLVVDGTISSNGNHAPSGTGSGGSVWIEATSLSGIGLISANGGITEEQGVTGGGGRVAIYADSTNFIGVIQATGGKTPIALSNALAMGTAGTVYIKASSSILNIAGFSGAAGLPYAVNVITEELSVDKLYIEYSNILLSNKLTVGTVASTSLTGKLFIGPTTLTVNQTVQGVALTIGQFGRLLFNSPQANASSFTSLEVYHLIPLCFFLF